MNERKKILWLVSWYPNKYDAFDGDFIQRHAEAASLYDDVHVLFVKQQEGQVEEMNSLHQINGLTEQIVYLLKQKGLTGKWKAYRSWSAAYKKAVDNIVKKDKPDFIHVHIPWKAGLIALWAKKKYGIPYIVTEHWGIYNRVVSDNIYTWPFIFRSLLKKIYQRAYRFVSVSQYLGDGVNKTLIKKDFLIIPNVVDTTLFFPVAVKQSRFRFLHVSNMVPLKNAEGILSAFQNFLNASGADAELVLVGNRDEHYPSMAKGMGLLNVSILFRGEVPHEQIAVEMQSANAFVLNSDIENSPCVICEALCCGLPVITTSVGGIPELTQEKNAVLIPARSETDLANAMMYIYKNYSRFTINEIASEASLKFSRPSVGNSFHYLYHLSE